jgi:hypothetical protein
MRPRVVFVLLVVVTVLAGCGPERPTVPKELIGVWQTSDPKYADRPFEIRKDVLIFKTGEWAFDFAVYAIARVEKRNEEGNLLYVITYIVPVNLEYKFSFFYTAAHGGEIRFRHQRNMVWRRAPQKPAKNPMFSAPPSG